MKRTLSNIIESEAEMKGIDKHVLLDNGLYLIIRYHVITTKVVIYNALERCKKGMGFGMYVGEKSGVHYSTIRHEDNATYGQVGTGIPEAEYGAVGSSERSRKVKAAYEEEYQRAYKLIARGFSEAPKVAKEDGNEMSLILNKPAAEVFPDLQEAGKMESPELPEPVVLKLDGYDYFLTPIDSTHVYLHSDKDRKGIPLHVRQLPNNKMSADVYAWLHSGDADELEKSYKAESKMKLKSAIESAKKVMELVKYAPTEGDIEKILIKMRNELGVRTAGAPVYRKFLTYELGNSNKYHYFAVFQKDNEFIAGNAAGPIGYRHGTVTNLGVFKNKQAAIDAAEKKMLAKMKTGYSPVSIEDY
jgi:predicted DNA-binding WGR domain protein